MRVLIADDEPLAREVLRQLLSARDDVEVVGEASSGTEAIEKIRGLRPDLVVLEVQMPGCDGFGVVREIGATQMPQVVFATAFDEHAVRAFEVHAVDYLLKPYTDDRFEQALNRALQAHQDSKRSELATRLMELVAASSPTQAGERCFAIKSGGAVYFLDAQEIDWIEQLGALPCRRQAPSDAGDDPFDRRAARPAALCADSPLDNCAARPDSQAGAPGTRRLPGRAAGRH